MHRLAVAAYTREVFKHAVAELQAHAKVLVRNSPENGSQGYHRVVSDKHRSEQPIHGDKYGSPQFSQGAS